LSNISLRFLLEVAMAFSEIDSNSEVSSLIPTALKGASGLEELIIKPPFSALVNAV
jgi:hypothetical protein